MHVIMKMNYFKMISIVNFFTTIQIFATWHFYYLVFCGIVITHFFADVPQVTANLHNTAASAAFPRDRSIHKVNVNVRQ